MSTHNLRSGLQALLALVAAILPATRAAHAAVPQAAPATRYIVGLPTEFSTQADGRAALAATLQLVTGAKPGDALEVFDARSLQRIVSVTIPVITGAQANSAKARLMRLEPSLAALQQHIGRGVERRGAEAGTLRVPEFLDLVARQRGAVEGATRVILLGAPFHRGAALTFGPGEFPCDATVAASSLESPFGARDRAGVLRGVTVHWGYFSETVFEAGEGLEVLARRHVTRFWSLYVGALGASLAAFCGDPALAVESALRGDAVPVVAERLDLSRPIAADAVLAIQRVELVRVAPAPPPSTPVATPSAPPAPVTPPAPAPPPVTEAPRPSPAPAPPAPTPPQPEQPPVAQFDIDLDFDDGSGLARTNEPAPLPRRSGPVTPGLVRVALVWTAADERTDLDLWIRPTSGSDELSFRKTSIPGARLLRDVRSAQRNTPNEADWVACWEVAELSMTTIERVAAEGAIWVNLFRANGREAIEAVVRIEDQFGRRTDIPIRFQSALTGDCAKGGAVARPSDRDVNPCWMRVDLTKALQLLTGPRTR